MTTANYGIIISGHFNTNILLKPINCNFTISFVSSFFHKIIHTYQNKSWIIVSCNFTVCLSVAIFVLYYSTTSLWQQNVMLPFILVQYGMNQGWSQCSIETWSMIPRQLRSSLFLARRAFFLLGFFVCWRIYSFVCLFVCVFVLPCFCLFVLFSLFVCLFVSMLGYMYVCLFVLIFLFLFCLFLLCFVLFYFVLFCFFAFLLTRCTVK